MIGEEARLFRLFLIVGGFVTPFRIGKGAAYRKIWGMCVLLCGVLCGINLKMQEPPFHYAPLDVAVTWGHIPAVLAIRFWRRNFKGKNSACWHCPVLCELFDK